MVSNIVYRVARHLNCAHAADINAQLLSIKTDTNAKWDFSGPQNLKKWTFGNIKGNTKFIRSFLFSSPPSTFHPLPLRGPLTPKKGKRDIFQVFHGGSAQIFSCHQWTQSTYSICLYNTTHLLKLKIWTFPSDLHHLWPNWWNRMIVYKYY